MSSMFKKKSGAGFKPKAPIARPRPPGASQPPRPSQQPAAAESPLSTAATNTPTTGSPARDAAATADAVPPVTQPTASETPAPADEIAPPAIVAPAAEPAQHTPEIATKPTKVTTQTQLGGQPGPSTQAKKATPALHAPQILTSSTPIATTEAEPEAETTPTDEVSPSSTSVETPKESSSAPKKTAARKPRKRTAAAITDDGAEGTSTSGDAGAESAPVKKRVTSRKATGEDTVKPKRRKQSDSVSADTPDRQATPRTRHRSPTPEDAEHQQVDLSSMTMSDLTKDLRIGRKSKVHDMLLAREREKMAAAKLKKAGLTPDGDASIPGTPASTSQAVTFLDKEIPSSEPTGLQYTMIGGQIVVDQSSLSLDRHERARQQQLASGGITAEMEEDDFTNHVTETSFRTGSKLRGPNYWNDEDTTLFYRGLAMLGTDFTLISRMFPGRNRRHVKMKFNREEKSNPDRINDAIIGTKSTSLDMDEYKHWTKAEYEPVEDIMAAHRAKEAEFEEQTKRIAEEKAEANRKKKEALFADDEDAAAGAKKKGKKKRKGAVETNLWGEVVEETPVEAA